MIRSPPMRFESEQPPPPPPPPPPPSRGAFSVEGHRCVHERCATWPLVKRCTQYSSVKHACATRPFGPVFIVLARYHHLPRRSLHGIQLDPTCLSMFTLRGWGSRWTKNVYRNRFFFFSLKGTGVFLKNRGRSMERNCFDRRMENHLNFLSCINIW